MTPKRAVILVSGGLDSLTVVAMAQAHGFEVYALTFSYGQRNLDEIAAAYRIARHRKVAEHLVVEIDPRLCAGSALTDGPDVPKGRELDDMRAGVPPTYVPARNTMFLSCALAWAEVVGACDIFIGAHARARNPDTKPEYLKAFAEMANLATNISDLVWIHAPLLHMTKQQVIQAGIAMGLDYSITLTCHDPSQVSGFACGECDACKIRLDGFAQNGVRDPVPYAGKALRC